MRQWLIDFRATKNMIQKDVAIKVGCSRNFYTMIERGQRTPKPLLAQKIAQVLDFDWTLFFTNQSNKTTQCETF